MVLISLSSSQSELPSVTWLCPYSSFMARFSQMSFGLLPPIHQTRWALPDSYVCTSQLAPWKSLHWKASIDNTFPWREQGFYDIRTESNYKIPTPVEYCGKLFTKEEKDSASENFKFKHKHFQEIEKRLP